MERQECTHIFGESHISAIYYIRYNIEIRIVIRSAYVQMIPPRMIMKYFSIFSLIPILLIIASVNGEKSQFILADTIAQFQRITITNKNKKR